MFKSIQCSRSNIVYVLSSTTISSVNFFVSSRFFSILLNKFLIFACISDFLSSLLTFSFPV